MKWHKWVSIVAVSVACSGCVSSGVSGNTTALTPSDPTVRVNHEKAARLNSELGVAYLEKGQTARAKTKLLRARELAPHLPEVHYSLAYFLETVGDLSEARIAYERALAMAPASGEANNNYGTFLCRQSDFLQADKHFQIALADKSYIETAAVFENAGICIQQANEPGKAKGYFLKAVKHDPRRAGPWLELAYLSLEAEDYNAARFYYKQYETTPHSTIARGLYMKSKLSRYAGNADEAASAELMLRSQFPDARETLELTE